MCSEFIRNVSIQVTVVVVLSACAHGQQPTPTSWRAPIEKRDAWRKGRQHVYTDDFGELKRYRAANAQLKPPAAGEKRVVFYGDSITDLWPLAAAFPGKPYVNRGISGQTTSQLLVRFRADVIALEPTAVVILAGTNDIAGNTGPISREDIEAQLRDDGRAGAGARDPRRARVGAAGPQLHADVASCRSRCVRPRRSRR